MSPDVGGSSGILQEYGDALFVLIHRRELIQQGHSRILVCILELLDGRDLHGDLRDISDESL